MKKLVILAFLISLNSLAQATIEKTDGSKINVDEVMFDVAHEKMTYFDGNEKVKLKYKDVKSVVSDRNKGSNPIPDYTWRYFPKAKKFKGMFIKAETDGKILGFTHYTLEAGGASGGHTSGVSSSFKHVHLTVFDKQGTVIDDTDLRYGLQNYNVKTRGEAVEMINKHFSDCPNFTQEFTSFVTADDDSKKLRIVNYFMMTKKIKVKNYNYDIELNNFINCN